MVARSGSLLTPRPVVALPWGSESMRRTLKSFAASEADKLIAVVVLPTPPFWFVTAITLLKFSYASIMRFTWNMRTVFHVKQCGCCGAHPTESGCDVLRSPEMQQFPGIQHRAPI